MLCLSSNPQELMMVGPMEDSRSLELYANFLANFQTCDAPAITDRILLTEESSFEPAAGFFEQQCDCFLRELFNSINRFRRDIKALSAWMPIFNACSDSEKLDLIVDHLGAIAERALGAPQAIRGRIIFAAATGASLANHEFFSDSAALQWNHECKNLTIKTLSKIEQPWFAWPDLAAALDQINPKEWSKEVGDFRNAREHGHPRGIGLGLTYELIIKGNGADREITFGSRYQIGISTVIRLCTERHPFVVNAYRALGTLLTHQLEALMRDSADGYIRPAHGKHP